MTTREDVLAAADAYVWGYPLVVMHRTRARQRRGLVQRDRLSTAADRAVVAPNNDTLYTSGWFDLRVGDVTVDVAAMDPPERYWSVMLLDAYTNVTYVCRRLHGSSGARVRVSYDPSTRAPTDRPLAVVPIGTPTLWVLARVLVDGPDDLPAARVAQTLIQICGEKRSDSDTSSPQIPPSSSFWDELRAALAVDPPAPWHPPLPGASRALLGRDDVDDELLADGIRLGKERLRAAGRGVDRTGNGWRTRLRGADFGDDVTYRAAFARVSLAGHLPAENRSYSRVVDGSRPVALRFPPGGEPPVRGFWSLSLYGTDMFFVANEIDRYSLGDRTSGLQRDADGSLTVTIGHDRPAEVANWLPAPAGPCVLALRCYEGGPEVVEATWSPPELIPAPDP